LADRAGELLITGLAVAAAARLANVLTADQYSNAAIDTTLTGDVVLVALLAVAGVVTITDPPGDKINRGITTGALIYFGMLVVSGAIELYRAGYTSGEVTGLVVGSLFARGGLATVLILVSIYARPFMNRLPTVSVSGLITRAASERFYSAADLTFTTGRESAAFAVSGLGNATMLAAAALVLASKANKGLGMLLQRTAWVSIALTAVAWLVFLGPADDDNFRSRSVFVSDFIQDNAATSLGVLAIVLVGAVVAKDRVSPSSPSGDSGLRYPALGITTLLMLIFWPTGVFALTYASRAHAAAEAGDDQLAARMHQTANNWRIVTSVVGALLIGFLVIAALSS